MKERLGYLVHQERELQYLNCPHPKLTHTRPAQGALLELRLVLPTMIFLKHARDCSWIEALGTIKTDEAPRGPLAAVLLLMRLGLPPLLAVSPPLLLRLSSALPPGCPLNSTLDA